MDAINIFEYVTFNLSDLISSIEIRYPQLSPGIILMSGGVHDGGILQS